MKFILCNTDNYNKKMFGLDENYFKSLEKCKIQYTRVYNEFYDVLIDIDMFELLLLRDEVGELIITKNTTYLQGNDIYPIIEIYDGWRE